MARILIVEDEEKIARFVTLELEHEGYQVEHAADGRTAVDLALERNYDLILLDVLLPQLNGMEVLRRVRKHKDVPVIMVTARDAVMDKVAGLDAGADDYLTKPFSPRELQARIKAVLRRRAPQMTEDCVDVEGLRIDPVTHRVTGNGKPHRPRADRVPAPAFFHDSRRTRAHARAAPRSGVGRPHLRRGADRRRTYPSPARFARSDRPRSPDPDGARYGLPILRPV